MMHVRVLLIVTAYVLAWITSHVSWSVSRCCSGGRFWHCRWAGLSRRADASPVYLVVPMATVTTRRARATTAPKRRGDACATCRLGGVDHFVTKCAYPLPRQQAKGARHPLRRDCVLTGAKNCGNKDNGNSKSYKSWVGNEAGVVSIATATRALRVSLAGVAQTASACLAASTHVHVLTAGMVLFARSPHQQRLHRRES